MSTSSLRWASVILMIVFLAACDDGQTEIARVSFMQPADYTTVAGGLHLEVRAQGVTIEEAGKVHHNAGHFHVIADDGCVAPGPALTHVADHVHFGGGQTEGTIYVEPGT